MSSHVKIPGIYVLALALVCTKSAFARTIYVACIRNVLGNEYGK